MGVVLHSQIKLETKTPTIFPNVVKKDGVYVYRPLKFLKFSMKSELNDGQIYNMVTKKTVYKADDYLRVGSIDMRMKIYLIPRVHFVMGGNFSGLSGYSMNSGLIIKI